MARPQRLLALVVVAACGLAPQPVDAQDALVEAAFTVAGVTVDVTAGDAAEARTRALAEGHRRALDRLFERIVPAAEQARLPHLSDDAIAELVQSFEVADERVAPDRYIASLTFHFKPDAVGGLLRAREIPYVEAVSPPIVVVPLMRRGESWLLWEDNNPWRAAWAGLPAGDGLVPVVVPFGELADLQLVGAEAAAEGDRERLDALAERYGGGEAVVVEAVAGKDESEAPTVEVTVRRYDSGGVRLGGGTYGGTAWDSLASVLETAAAETRRQIEAEWKEANVLRFERENALVADLEFAGLADWLDLRDRIDGLAIVRRTTVDALSPRFARIVVHYLGEPRQLADALGRADLTLAAEAGLWVIRRPDGDAAGDGAGSPPTGALAQE